MLDRRSMFLIAVARMMPINKGSSRALNPLAKLARLAHGCRGARELCALRGATALNPAITEFS